MVSCGYSLADLESIVCGKPRLRIFASAPQELSARVTWPCGCRAEGPDPNDLLLLERCHDHRLIGLPEGTVL